jgi:hypothetical protein
VTRRWPSQRIGAAAPEAVSTGSPTASASIATGPRGVRMRVPAAKQPIVVLTLL